MVHTVVFFALLSRALITEYGLLDVPLFGFFVLVHAHRFHSQDTQNKKVHLMLCKHLPGLQGGLRQGRRNLQKRRRYLETTIRLHLLDVVVNPSGKG